jgi:hypothetical protein
MSAARHTCAPLPQFESRTNDSRHWRRLSLQASGIATAILAHDESQIDYYAEIVKRMPGPVLSRRGIVTRTGDDYTVTDDLRDLTDCEREDLITLCREKVITRSGASSCGQ